MTKLLALMETDGARIDETNLAAVKFAQQLARTWQAEFDLLVIGGREIESQLDRWRALGAGTIWTVAAGELTHLTADRVASVCTKVISQAGADALIGGATTFGK